MTSARRVLLSADDFGFSDRVSEAIADLAERRRLSATTAMTTTASWMRSASSVAALRRLIAIGFHLNLTEGMPLGPLPSHAADGRLPPVSTWIRAALVGRIAADEVGAEIERQLDRFEAVAGAPPDVVDGHHHVHGLRGIRTILLGVLARRYGPDRLPLVRVPTDSPLAILARRSAATKALVVCGLSLGLRAEVARIGAPTNVGFSGFSGFDPARSYSAELGRFLMAPGRFHMVMCHPGEIDADGEGADEIAASRVTEYRALLAEPDLETRLFHPADWRDDGGRIDWRRAET